MPSYLTGGAITEEFLADEKVVDEQATPHYDRPLLVLKGQPFDTAIILGDIETVVFRRSWLILRTKQVAHHYNTTRTFNAPSLVLNARVFDVPPPVVTKHARPLLMLRGKTFRLRSDTYSRTGKPTLILKAGAVTAALPGLVPSGEEQEDLIVTTEMMADLIQTTELETGLVPTDEESLDLIPTTEENRDLVPTVEETR